MNLKNEMEDRKRAYIELEEASWGKTQILSTVSHELKTPLTSIVGYVDRLLLDQEKVGPLNPRQQRYLEAVHEDSHRLKALIDDLLDISRIESGSLELNVTELNVREEVEAAVRPMQLQFDEK